MSHWNYRVRASTVDTTAPGTDPVERFDVIEVFYGDNNRVLVWSDPQAPEGESLSELRADLERMLEALDKPIVHAEQLP